MPWPLSSLLNLQSSRYVSFPITETNGLTRFALNLIVRPPNTIWFTSTKTLVTRTGQFILRAQGTSTGAPNPSGFLLNFGVTPAGGGTPIFRGLADTADNRALLKGRMCHFIGVTYDAGTVRMWVDGHEVTLTGTGTVPTSLRTVAGSVDLRLGDTDSLSASIGNLSLWTGGAIPTPAMMVAIWNRHAPCDLSTGFGDGPRGEQVAITLPSNHWPCSGDVLPDVEPRVGVVRGTCLPSSPALDTKIPISPALDLDDFADVRFAIKNGQEGYDTEPFFEMPSICIAPISGHLLVVYSHGSGHSTPNTDALIQRNAIDGVAWAWPSGRAWPGETEEAAYAFDTTEAARGGSIQVLASGRIIHTVAVRSEAHPPVMPLPGAPDLNEDGYRIIRHSDDDGYTWSAWRYMWPGYPFGMPGSARFIELPNGDIMVGVYKVPFDGATYRNLESLISHDQTLTWVTGPTIHDGASDGYEWEEPHLGWLSHGHPTGAGGAGWACLARVDYPYPARVMKMYASDLLAMQWGPATLALNGWNCPVWKEAPDGTVYLITGAPSATGNLDESFSMLYRSTDGLVTWDAGTWLGHGNAGTNMGHGIAFEPDGTIHIVVASAQVGSPYTGFTICEYLRIDGDIPEPEPEPPVEDDEPDRYKDSHRRRRRMTGEVRGGVSGSRTAGQQFDGTEHAMPFALASRELELVEVNASLGPEPKTWTLVKIVGSTQYPIATSGIDTTATSIYLRDFELGSLILPGERFGLITSGATSAMNARFYFKEPD